MLHKFITALQFLTVFRVKKDREVSENELARSMAYFPFVGFVIGIILVYADKAFQRLFPDTISNIFLILLSVLITRALHIDGLADSVDGIMGGYDHESRLAIMRDSRIGTAGVLSILFVLFIKYVCLNNLFDEHKTAALLTAPAFSRWAQMLMMFGANYGREDGMGKVFVGHLRSSGLVAASTAAVGLTAFVIVREEVRTAILALVLIVGVVLFTLLARRYLVRKLGGVTGDSIGAVSELNEVLVYLIFVILSGES